MRILALFYCPDPDHHSLECILEKNIIIKCLDFLSILDTCVDETDENGMTPLMWAASYGQVPTVRLLLQKRANIDFEVKLN